MWLSHAQLYPLFLAHQTPIDNGAPHCRRRCHGYRQIQGEEDMKEKDHQKSSLLTTVDSLQWI
jgi:hypothetical protein